MLSAQLESSPTSRVVLTRPSHGKPIDPFTHTSKTSVPHSLSVTIRVLPRFHMHSTYQGGWYGELPTEQLS